MLLLLAPMEGVVDPIMRNILTSIGGFDFCATEFIRVTDKLLPPHVFHKYSPELIERNGRTSSGTPVFIQLLGGQTGPMSENALRAVELGALGVDINFGCPAKTVNRHDGGAAILKNPTRVFDIVRSVREATPNDTPVTVKIRLGFENSTLAMENALAAEEAGSKWLTIHARTKVDGYKPPAKWSELKEIKEKLNIPVIANGDIWTPDDLINCARVSNCENFMIGRGVIADPFLAKKIRLHNKLFSTSEDEWNALKPYVIIFIQESAKLGNKFVLARTKQWLKLLGRNHLQALECFEKIKRIKSIESIENDLIPLI